MSTTVAKAIGERERLDVEHLARDAEDVERIDVDEEREEEARRSRTRRSSRGR